MKLFHLWVHDRYVDLDGSIDSPTLLGTFDSLESLNQHWSKDYDYRRLGVFNDVDTEFECQARYEDKRYFITQGWLNEEAG